MVTLALYMVSRNVMSPCLLVLEWAEVTTLLLRVFQSLLLKVF